MEAEISNVDESHTVSKLGKERQIMIDTDGPIKSTVKITTKVRHQSMHSSA